MSEAALRAHALSKHLGRRAVLDGIDFSLERGEISALLGANGAGKTTLLRVLAGLSLPSAGRIEVATSSDRKTARSTVGYLGHDTMLYGALSAEENLAFAARLYGRGRERIGPLLEAVGLAGVAHHKVASFSRGMRQRLALARAQVHDPAILLLDEPFNALDPNAADALADSLRATRETGTAICLVSHDLERVARLADSAWLLRESHCHRLASPLTLEGLRRALEDAR